MSYRGQQRYNRYERSYDQSQSSWGDRDNRYSSRYSDSRSVDPSAQLAAANAILSAVLQSQKGSYGRDRRDSYRRSSYRSRGRGYRGSRPFRSRPYEDHRSREGRDKESRSSETKEDKEEQHGEEATDKGPEEKKKENWKFRCHLCWKYADTEEQHLEHLETEDHSNKMEERKARYKRQIQAIVFKLRRKEEFEQRRGGHGRRGFCTVCNVNFYGLSNRHNNSPLHRDMKNLKQAYCRFCDLRFVERIDYDRHILTIKHLKIRAKKLSQEEQLKPEDMEVLDSVGEEDEVDEDLEYPDEWDGEEAVGKQCVRKVVGYFCKLCCKFFTEEEQNLDSHCKGEQHYNGFVDYAKAKKEELLKKKEEKGGEEEEAHEEPEMKEEEENGDLEEEMDAEDAPPEEDEEEEPADEAEETPADEEPVEEEKKKEEEEEVAPRRGRGRPAKKSQ